MKCEHDYTYEDNDWQNGFPIKKCVKCGRMYIWNKPLRVTVFN
jgi:hypothetical protein